MKHLFSPRARSDKRFSISDEEICFSFQILNSEQAPAAVLIVQIASLMPTSVPTGKHAQTLFGTDDESFVQEEKLVDSGFDQAETLLVLDKWRADVAAEDSLTFSLLDKP